MMETLRVHTASAEYPIYINEFEIGYLKTFVSGKSCLIVTDSNLAPLYLGPVKTLLESAGASAAFTLAFDAGEASKTFQVVETICRTAAMRRLNRKSLIIALGGGVTGDMAGFAAAIYMRGIDFIQIPTSLLAMVDSSVGGKTGADLPEGKNLIGAFHQPLAVFANTPFLKTLPERQFRCGIAEILKMAATLDRAFFEKLEQNTGKYHDEIFLSAMIRRSCELKADIVARDEKEGNIRAWLNFGHTFGHALESISEFTLPHGEGVAAGIQMAVRFGVYLGITPSADAERVSALVDKVCPPEKIPFFSGQLINAMTADKKTMAGQLRFVLMPELGKASIVIPEMKQLSAFLEEYPQ